MALERRNPLPVGRYWVDVFGPDIASFRDWLDANKNSVHIESDQYHLPDMNPGGMNAPERHWYLFSVSSSTDWKGPGFPTIADETVHAEPDTSQRPPPPPSISDQIDDIADSAKKVAQGAMILGGGLLLYKILQLLKR